MPVAPLKCPQCGGTIELQSIGEAAKCAYCGTQHSVPEGSARQLTPEEIQARLTEARLHVENMMDVMMPNRRKITFAITAFIFIVAALVIGGILVAITTAFRH
ncbi:MAG: hypothetical protein RL088_2605 [Verrucomicrobiota bacterium]|jgi:uncharacterized membrane protein YvbJ